MNKLATLAMVSLMAALLTAQAVWAGPGHDHGEAEPAATGPALPRFAAASELFELVGVLQGQQLTLYLDRAADNSPVSDAQIELEIAGQPFQAARLGADLFEIVLPQAPGPGVLQIVATVNAGADSDLLAAELTVADDEPAHADDAGHAHSWTEFLPWVAGGAALLLVLAVAVFATRRLLRSRLARAGGVA